MVHQYKNQIGLPEFAGWWFCVISESSSQIRRQPLRGSAKKAGLNFGDLLFYRLLSVHAL